MESYFAVHLDTAGVERELAGHEEVLGVLHAQAGLTWVQLDWSFTRPPITIPPMKPIDEPVAKTAIGKARR